MDKNQKIIIFGAIGIFTCLAILIVALLIRNISQEQSSQATQEEIDSLRIANNKLSMASMAMEFDRLNSEFEQVNNEFSQYEGQQVYLKDDEIIRQYDDAKKRITQLLAELDKERKSANSSAAKVASLEGKIRELEAEIGTLKGIVRHYLEEIKRLGDENAGLKRELEQVSQRNETLASQNATVSQNNAELRKEVTKAKKLNITNLSLSAYNNKGKNENKISKAKKLGVSFTVSPNNAASPGNKTFYVRIISPEGSLLGGGTSFSYDGASVAGTAARSMEYDNNELPVSVYWDVNTTLTPGDYTVEVFCDGQRLGSKHFSK